jgi:hypothetical protein
MAEETLDQRVADASGEPEEKEEKKPQGVLESVIDETLGAAKSVVNVGLGTAVSVGGYALTGNPGVLATSGAYLAGTKGKKDSKIARQEFMGGAAFGTFAHYTTLPLQALTNVGKAAFLIPWAFGANAFYLAADHLIKNYSFKGLGKKFKEDYIPVLKKAMYTAVPINIASAILLPAQYMVAAIAGASYVFRRFVIGGEGKEHTDKTPYYKATANVTRKLLGNTAKGISDIGRAIYTSIPKGSPTTPEPAPAGGHA